jgi:phospho-N-acetylmuramoyl-pentapeptide-transferase
MFFDIFGTKIYLYLLSIISSYLFSSYLIKKYIIAVKNNNFLSQPIRDDGVKSHLLKKNTPTMGGIFIIFATLLSVALFGNINCGYTKILSIILVSFGMIGFIDDLLKIIYKNPNGLKGSIKIILQFIIIGVIYLKLINIDPIYRIDNIFLAINDGFFIEIPTFIFILFISCAIIGSANGVNLTDGLDGLVSVPAIICLISLIILTIYGTNAYLASEVRVPYIAGGNDIIIFCTSLIGAILGFLKFNLKPAKIFMGDVGSLAIGGVVGTIAVILKQEFIFFFIALLFVIESLSVILQVASFKIRKKRIFLMAPIHHHFEKKGMSELQVVRLFWLFSLISAIMALIIYFYV